MDFGNIIVRDDGSYVINDGMYHVPNEGAFADMWAQVHEYALANPDKVTQEVIEIEPEPTLEQLKEQKLVLLENRFNRYRESSDTYLVSSLGFKANANITAFDNVSGLVAQLQHRIENGEENTQVGFMTFDDELVLMDLTQMKTLQVEISQNGSNIYSQKWALRQAIKAAEDKEVLDAIEIVFIHTDFSTNA